MKEKRIILLIFILGIVVNIKMFFTLSNYFQGYWGGEKVEWFSEKSPNGKYILTVEKQKAILPFVKNNIDIFVDKVGKKTVSKEHNLYRNLYMSFMIDNKNLPLSEDNYTLEWTKTGVILTFQGKWQKNVSYIIDWDNVFYGEENHEI